jgi:heme O synthase-like polyprenyltransferase
MATFRTWLVLGRISNLPTVWSNCLAGWWLGGGGNPHNLPLLLAGATLLYVGGMFLNDAFDANFDAQYRRERPIPSGAVSATVVWQIGLGLLAVGILCLFLLGKTCGSLAVALTVCILAYDAVHKLITLSPVLMAGCRFFLYPMAASTGAEGITGWSLWCGIALATYIVGLSYIARKESTGAALRYWPCFFMAVPVLWALIMNATPFLERALLISAVLALWVIRCLRYTFGAGERNIGRTVSGLLAGIVWVDLLAVADVPRDFAMGFIVLFLLSLLFQRFVPAT